MNPFYPRILARGEGGAIELDGGRVIGALGEWRLCTFGDDRPYLTARGCQIASYWRSAGVSRLVVRPRRAANAPPLVVTGAVKRMEADALNLGDLTIEGIPGQEGGPDGNQE
jgi:hypothetical protein